MSRLPSSSATLGNTPLLHLLASMLERTTSGTLTLESPDGAEHAVVFEHGIPRKVAAAAPQTRLSDLFIEFGWLDPPSAAQTYAAALEQGEHHGKVLVDVGLVNPEGLSQVLVYQLIRKLAWLSALPPATELALQEESDLLEGIPMAPDQTSPLAILSGVAKGYVDEGHKRLVLERVAHLPLQLHHRSTPELFGFSVLEMSLIERLRHVRMDIGSLLYQIELVRHSAETLLYLLLLTRHIDIGDGRMPIGLAGSPPTVQPKASGEFAAVRLADAPADAQSLPDPSDAAGTLRTELQLHAARLQSDDHYALLGVARDAPIATIRSAFTTQARRFHPERLPVELNDLRPIAAQLLTRMMTAYRELADAAQRTHYDQAHPQVPFGPDHDRLTKLRLSADALRRAEQLLKRDRLLLAEAAARRALELDPDNPECLALHAWIRAQLPESGLELEQILKSLTLAMDRRPADVQIRYFRSEILKRLDRLDEAVSEWRLITELDPSHVDALRELRLWEMRRGSSRPVKKSTSGTHPQVSLMPESKGFFGKLFRSPR